MKAIILAAGKGTRISRYAVGIPKGMLSISGKTIIERQINAYRKKGINDIIVVRGYMSNLIQYKGVKYYDNLDYESTNMVMSLIAARNEFNDDVIVSYSDILFDKEILDAMVDSPFDISVCVDTEWKDYWEMRYGSITTDIESLRIGENDLIVTLGDPTVNVDDIDARYVGILKFSERGLQKIKEIIDKESIEYGNNPWKTSGRPIKQAYMTDLLQALIDNHYPVNCVKTKKGWLEFDTNEDYEKVVEWIKNKKIQSLINID